MKVIYPAIFHHEEDSYWVEFPDLEGCHTCGDTLAEALSNAQEALSIYCVTMLEEKLSLTPPSDIQAVSIPEGAFATLVESDLIMKSKAVKKTLTIPSWLNEAAEKRGVNFSAILQNALVKELSIM